MLLKLKMAKKYSCEEVLALIVSEPNIKNKKEDAEGRVREVLATFAQESSTEVDNEFFVSAGSSALVPIWNLATQMSSSGKVNACQVLAFSQIKPVLVFQHEAKLWLSAISRRLVGRQSVRSPYRGEINRDIPFELFAVLARLVKACSEYAEPFCYYSSNKKGAVISFTSLRLVVDFFSFLSGYSADEVRTYFKRKISRGARNGHVVSLITTDVKDFALIYKQSQGRLTISFHFGEWNTAGFPQHAV